MKKHIMFLTDILDVLHGLRFFKYNFSETGSFPSSRDRLNKGPHSAGLQSPGFEVNSSKGLNGVRCSILSCRLMKENNFLKS
jgi:hypothetical protein